MNEPINKEDVTKADDTNKSIDEVNSKSNIVVRHKENTNSLSTLNLLDEKHLASAELFLKKYIASDKSGIKSIADGLAIMTRAQDLQLPFTTSVEHIHVINGKTGVDIHIVKSLLLRAGVVWECTKDYTPQYQYTDGNTIYLETLIPDYCIICRTPKEAESKTNDNTIGVYPLRYYQDLKGNLYNEFQVSDKCVKCINKLQAIQVAKEGKFPVMRVAAQPVDYVTEYLFKRIRVINGREYLMTAKGHFSYTEAQTADFFTKDTYKKYARVMIGHRAFTLGARDIGDDLLMGVMESTELKVAEGIDLDPADFTEVN